ncbi:MAG: hypothetical protein KAU29_07595 [Gammaproteobacteria bacterium]|nr:hypothetical protein [Gammaproteobacteria bacterium]
MSILYLKEGLRGEGRGLGKCSAAKAKPFPHIHVLHGISPSLGFGSLLRSTSYILVVVGKKKAAHRGVQPERRS